jgi:ABC-type microcin C transport system duplicated ATPase subunit YejF
MTTQLVINKLKVSIKSNNGYITPIEDLNLTLYKGEILVLLGESGCGKSLTAKSILQILPNNTYFGQQSSILFNNQDLLDTSEKEMQGIRGHKIAMIFQDPMASLNPVFTIGDQILESLKIKYNYKKNNSKLDFIKKAKELLKEVGLVDTDRNFKAYPHELSGGMRQRAVIAMALAAEPELLLADEPTTALDVTMQEQILQLLLDLQKKYNMTLLFITHNLGVVAKIADRVAVMFSGRIVEVSDKFELLHHPKHEYTKTLISSQLTIHSSIAEPLIRGDNNTILYVNNLTVRFPLYTSFLRRIKGYITAVNNISFNLQEHSTIAIVGESGSGKSSVAKALMGLIAYSGTISKSNNLMQIIFQDPYSAFNPRMMVIDILREGYLAIFNQILEVEKLVDILQKVGLSADALYKYPHEFSGGQRQRIAIARALTVTPKILILDEATSALDLSVQVQILKLLKELQQLYSLSYIIITHDVAVVANMANYTLVMHHGKIVESGSTKELLTNPQDTYTKQLLAAIPDIKTK